MSNKPIHPIRIFVRMILFVEKPQSLPSSYHWVIYSAAALLFISAWVGTVGSSTWNFKVATVKILIDGAAVWALLRLVDRAARWKQTVTALFGTSCLIIAAAYYPIELVWLNVKDDPEQIFILGLIVMPFGIWVLAVTVMIIKEALETTVLRAFFISLGLEIFTAIVVSNLFGAGLPQPPVQ